MDTTRLRQLWQRGAANHGDKIYLHGADRTVTYSEAYDCILRGARVIRENGWAVHATPLATDIQDPIKLTLLVGACVEADASLAFVPDLRSAGSLRATLNDIGSMMLVTDRVESPEQNRVVDFDQLMRTEPVRTMGQTQSAAETELGCFILQTSGTEGEPRWVACRYQHCLSAIRGMDASGALQHARNQIVYLTPPLSHSYGLSSMLEYTFCGSTIVFPGNDSPLGPVGDLVRSSMRNTITSIEGVPFFYSQLCKLLSRVSMPALSYVGTGAGAMQPTVLAAIGEHRSEISCSIRYGLTETPSAVTHKVFRFGRHRDLRGCGTVTGAYQLEIRDESGRLLQAGQEGEIVVRGDCVSAYLGLPSGGAHTTGDLGYLDADGELHVVGRKSVFLKHRGFRLSPERVESVLIAARGITDCRVLTSGGNLVAEIVETDNPLPHADVLRYVEERLPAYCVPKTLIRVDAIPRTRSGKIVRR